MKVTIELETKEDVSACHFNPLELVGLCVRHLPNRPTVVVRVLEKANGAMADTNGDPVLSGVVITVTPKTKV